MCILGMCCCPGSTWATSATTARFPIVVVNNRDEYLSRPTTPFSVDPVTGIACFRDGLAGGTWMGINVKTRAFAALTNSRDAYTGRHGDESRGQLIVRALMPESEQPQPHSAEFDASHYDGFNFVSCADLAAVAAGREALLYSTNRAVPGAMQAEPVQAMPLAPAEVHVVSNTFLDNWSEPKTRYLRAGLATVLADATLAEAPIESGLLPRLGELLCSRNCDTCLRESAADCGVELDTEDAEGVEKRYASAKHVFDAGVKDELGVHATRTQSVIVVERVQAAAGDDEGPSRFTVHYFVRDVDGSTRELGAWRHTTAAM
uniref:Transport and Golgi organization protein 2 n=1 Tax=Neobodo designis TaxID=312471 RepID=A0A6U4SR30_NEODS|mmetsp:Transcript_31393/g.96981  ORF Transcript_31393/g.96981 Transcript_31393/m.96981 type:complete len:318 (+) Transcript_31393:41-994(+)